MKVLKVTKFCIKCPVIVFAVFFSLESDMEVCTKYLLPEYEVQKFGMFGRVF